MQTLKDKYLHAEEVGSSHRLGRVHERWGRLAGSPEGQCSWRKHSRGEPGSGRSWCAGCVTVVIGVTSDCKVEKGLILNLKISAGNSEWPWKPTYCAVNWLQEKIIYHLAPPPFYCSSNQILLNSKKKKEI